MGRVVATHHRTQQHTSTIAQLLLKKKLSIAIAKCKINKGNNEKAKKELLRNMSNKEASEELLGFGRLLLAKKNYTQALSCLMLAADMSNPKAMYVLAALYSKGITGTPLNVIEPDHSIAIKWLTKAVECSGDNPTDDTTKIKAMLNIGFLLSNKLENLGRCLMNQLFNPTEAMSWFQKAAEQPWNHVTTEHGCSAALAIGTLYQLGWVTGTWAPGTTIRSSETWQNGQSDETNALNWYLKAANAGNLQGMYRAGLLLLKRQNVGEATHWFTTAAKQNHPLSVEALEVMKSKSYPINAREWQDQKINVNNF
jgi:TPR repeat protein